MGAVSVDVHAKDRVLDVMYPIDTEAGVSKLMYALPYVKEKRFLEGDYGACNLVLDIQDALEHIHLTDIQRRIIQLHYHEDLTQAETAKRLEAEGFAITQQGVAWHVKTINRRLSQYHKEGVVVE